jgi:peptidoglycan/LPS O-acetylase OafA/YrhL
MQAGDALRALAALMVVVYHVLLGAALASGGPGARAIPTGQLMRDAYGRLPGDVAGNLNAGLYVFFVLTGYFVGGPYVRAWISGGHAPAAGRYLARRVRRIVPAFWLFAAISIVVVHPHGNSIGDLASVFGFAQNYHPSWTRTSIIQAWTLDIEATFYLALPLVALAIALALRGRRVRPGALLLALAALAAVSLAIAPRYPALTDSFSMSLPALLWAFVPGLALAALEPFVVPRLNGRSGRVFAFVLVAVAAAGFALVVHIPTARHAAHCVALALFGGALVAAALSWQWGTGGSPGWAVNRVTNALGRWSYGIYLCHFVLAVELVKLAPAGAGPRETALIAGPLTLGSSILVAALSWRFLERPALEWHAAPRVSAAPATAY